jgi:hypothetical protein
MQLNQIVKLKMPRDRRGMLNKDATGGYFTFIPGSAPESGDSM